ncbi:MAG: hypothetical protein HY815_07420 [Candidatus Riflebacteria bacterium]|nr:hypothetical protein [Candidatus Riflebacteria bacterium]
MVKKTPGPTKTTGRAKTKAGAKAGAKKERLVKCTGFTEREFEKHMKHVDKHGPGSANRCYLCHRSEKDASVCLDFTDEEVRTTELQFFEIHRNVGDLTFVFDLCFECALLLQPCSAE